MERRVSFIFDDTEIDVISVRHELDKMKESWEENHEATFYNLTIKRL